jgi:hypothetical protein
MFFTSIIETSDYFTIVVHQFITKDNFYNVIEEFIHYYTRVYSHSSFINADFYSAFCKVSFSTLIYNDYRHSKHVYKWNERRWGGGFPFFMFDYGVYIREAQGFGSGDGVPRFEEGPNENNY